jgi:uncharacterized protein (PEP-CTERM system associated)
MATDMAKKRTKFIAQYSVITVLITLPIHAGEWTFTPNINVNETYTNNVELTKDNKTTSYVNQFAFGVDSQFNSRLSEFSLKGSTTYVSYSHDHSLDDYFNNLTSKARYNLWTNGPAIIANASISNQSRNGADNSLADLVSGDIVEVRNYQTGIEYNISNSDFIIDSLLQYEWREADDNIGNSTGYSAILNSNNGNTARHMLWQLRSNYNQRDNNNLSGRVYSVEAITGVITKVRFNPFVRFFDENASGNILGNRNTSSTSWGPGFRWQLSSHFYFDLSYNYVSDKTKSDDYIATEINWQPSARTSLVANYSKRFFGDSYGLNFSHTLRRLTNTISYVEQVEAFDRNNYQQVSLGSFWCPIGANFSDDITNCFVNNNNSIDFTNYQLVTLFDQQLIESNEFSLNKRLNLSSTLTLARTTFSVQLFHFNRESLTTGRVEKTDTASASVVRHISPKSDLDITFNFEHRQFNNQSQNNDQEDYYRTISSTYRRKIARTLTSDFTLKYLNRTSTLVSRTYNETRASINIKKEF